MRFPGATHLVVGFQSRTEAERFLKEFRERLAKFGLELHAEKTRLIEFGRFAVENRKRRGEGKPETSTFLGLLWEAPEGWSIHHLASNGQETAGGQAPSN